MLVALGLATVASLIASAVLGVRLLRLSARTRKLPELVMGASFLIAGVAGYVLTLLGRPDAGIPPERAHAFFAWGYGLISVGVGLTYLFLWQVFHPGSAFVRTAVWFAWALLAVTIVPMVEARAALDTAPPFSWPGELVRMGSGLWGAFVALRYWRMMRRRVALGLADAAVANRFLLWGIAMASSFCIFLVTSVAIDGDRMTALHIAAISGGTLAAAVTQWLAFFPPEAYLRRLRRGSPAPA